MTRIAALGEVMIELSPAGKTTDNRELKALSYAGDSYNTAITLARLGVDTAYITRLGTDSYSDEILKKLQAEQIDTTAISRSSSAMPGLYIIHNREDGEREFLYWRERSAARELFDDSDRRTAIATFLSDCDWLYLSAISLAILAPAAREHCFAMLDNYKRQGGKVAYDSNYRPQLWASIEEARQTSWRAMQYADIALLTLDDETQLWGSQGDALAEARSRYDGLAAEEIIYKRGAEDVVVMASDGEYILPAYPVETTLDTTAAGDTFNAGYLACRLGGGSPTEAAREGSRCAGAVIQYRGAVIDRDSFFDAREKLSG